MQEFNNRMSGMSTRWYVVASKPSQEIRAWVGLTEQGFTTFLPQYKKKVRHAKQLKTVAKPYFPGYFFVHLDLARDNWSPICQTRGVKTILGVPTVGHPVPMPSGFVEAMNWEASHGGLHVGDEGARIFKQNERVRIEIGPFARCEAVVSEDDGTRVKILLDILGGSVQTSINREDLVPA